MRRREGTWLMMLVLVAYLPTASSALEQAKRPDRGERSRDEWNDDDGESRRAAPTRPRVTAQRAAPARGGGEGTFTDQDSFYVNAQYRGAVKKSFQNIGDGTIGYSKTGRDTFRVSATGKVTHPETHDVYDLDLDMSFALKGSNLTVTQNQNRFSEDTKWFKSRVERALPFLYLVRAETPGEGERATREYSYGGHTAVIRYTWTERNLEASVYEDDELIGKVFMVPGSRGPLAPVEKIRVPAPDNVMISFVVTR